MAMKRRRMRLAASARLDLKRIAEFVAQSDEPAAERLVIDLTEQIHRLAEIGMTGSSRPFLPERVRAFPYKRYCFYFTVDDDFLTIVRVLHSAQDTSQVTFDAPDK